MKIAIVVPEGLHPSGEQHVVPSWLALLERLARSHDIHAFVLRQLHEPTTYQLGGFTVHDLGRPSLPFGVARWAQQRALSFALRRHGPFDLIHGVLGEPAGLLAARAAQALDIPSVVTCDSGEFVSIPSIKFGSQRTASGRKAVTEACALATRVHVCTRFMAALAHAKNVRTAVIPLTSVTSAAAARPNSRRPHDAPFRIIQVAPLSRVSNQRLLIDALTIVREQVNAHLDLIGDDTLGGSLQRHAASIGLDAHITFHGFLPYRQAIDRLRAADLYVQSSLHEASGMWVLEAAAAGVPTVGTRAGYVADWAPLKATAVGDAIPESLADAILAAHADRDRRRSMAAAAQTVAMAQDATFSAMKFDELYRGLKR
jgi:glycosyltransferase involved in cell wall biosynthesis